MPVTIELKAIMPKDPKFQLVLKAAVDAMIDELDEAERLFNRFTRTWNHKPTWKKQVKNRRRDIVASLSTRSKPFVYVEGGTAVRRVAMTKDFQAKTKVRSLRSGPGRGGRAGLLKTPRGGIKAREAREVIADMRQKVAANNIQKKINIASKSVF